jgi:rhodanese-related sulfurtransferase
MNVMRRFALPLALSLGLAAPMITSVAVASEPATAVKKEGWYHSLIKVEEVEKLAVLPKKEGAVLIDSRPAARKYDLGHIQTAINIPDSQFEKLAASMLPEKKDTLLVFYCEGYECSLSHASAFKAEKMGYTNIKVFAEGFPEWVKRGNLVSISVPYVKKLLDEKTPMVLIDSRPKGRKYDQGHIPGAISLPDSQFEKLAPALLPADKNALAVFYCEGLICALSNESAMKAQKLGYTNVRVVPEGYPDWVKRYGPGPVAGAAPAPAAPALEQGKEAGTITVASFEKLFKEAPDSIVVIDVRDPKEFATGAFKGAKNIHINDIEKRIDELPADKPIVFVCGAGSRSGEAHDMVKLIKPALKTFFMDAQIKWAADGSYTMKQN